MTEMTSAAPPVRSSNGLALAVLAFCFSIGLLARGIVESFVVFLLPLIREFDSDRVAITSIYSTTMGLGGILAPFAGYIFDRLGPRSVYSTGLGVVAMGLLAASQANSLLQLQLCIGVGLGIGLAMLGNAINATMVSRWFLTRQAMVSSFVFSSLGVGILAIVPLSQFLIDLLGWRNAYLSLGLIVLVALAGTFFLPWAQMAAGHPDYRKAVSASGTAVWTLPAVVKNPAFWGLFACYFFTSQGMFSLTVQAVAYLVEHGYPALQAASAWGVTGILMPLGMLTYGWLDGAIGRHASIGLSYMTTLFAILAMWLIGYYPGQFLLWLFIFLMGSSLGSRGPLVAAISLRIFNGPNAGAIFGAVTLGGGLGGAAGAAWGGFIHDLTGSYGPVMALSAVSVICGGAPFWLVKSLRHEN